MISYKMQYPKFLFKKEQKDYSNDMFKVEDTQFLINTANPFNIIGVANQIKKDEARLGNYTMVASLFCSLLFYINKILKEYKDIVYMP